MYIYRHIRGCIQKFPDWVITKYTLTTINTRWETTQRVMAAKLTRLTHKIAMQLHLVAESFTICNSRSWRPVRKLLNTPSYTFLVWLLLVSCVVWYRGKDEAKYENIYWYLSKIQSFNGSGRWKQVSVGFWRWCVGIERIVLLDFIHRLVSQKIEE
jgi:hypothetical protein